MEYNPASIEPKWRQYWQEQQTYRVENGGDQPKFYILNMFPYPSGAGLHVGHPLGYIATDIYARYKRLKGFKVLNPMGYDAFGLPAEQYAIKTGKHPAEATAENTQRFREQLDLLGFSFDWSREVTTSDPNYYKWTQWIFLQLFQHYYDTAEQKAKPISDLVAVFAEAGNAGAQAAHSEVAEFSAEEWNNFSAKEQDDILMCYRLAYRKVGFVNWCEELGTVLANDEVKDGLSERGGFPVEQRPMMQWSLRITAYAERLLQGLEAVDFSEALKTQQRNWLGRSEGARLFFDIENSEEKIEVFTTRPDTIFGSTFMVVAPEHELLNSIVTPEQEKAVSEYQQYAKTRSERDRQADVKTITGAFTGAYALHPFSGERLPIWTSEYVLVDYGTGAIMAVPSDDERDQRFAQHFDLSIIKVVDQSDFPDAEVGDKVGKMINSNFLNDLPVKKAIPKAIEALEEKGIGRKEVNFKLRDANFSRQRYWGEPFPIEYDAEGVAHPVKDLPVELPKMKDFKPSKDGRAPLAKLEDWVAQDGRTREVDTMPGFAGSSWYYLRYMDPDNADAPFSPEAVNYWQSVDVYLGGAEHAVGHLLYSRFWHKFLYDLGKVPTAEPYKKLINQGMIQGVIEMLYLRKEKRGDGRAVFVSADRLAEFGGAEQFTRIATPIEFVQNYNLEAASYLDEEGMQRFREWSPEYEKAIFETNSEGKLLTHNEVGKMSKSKYNVINPDDMVQQYGADCFRMYEMFLGPLEQSKPWDTQGISGVEKFLRRFWALFYKEGQWIVTEEKPSAEMFKSAHTAIKKVNEDIENFAFNTCVPAFMVAVNELTKLNCHHKAVLEDLVILIAPFAPHLAEELWEQLGHQGSVLEADYPQHKEEYLKEDSFEYPVCVNGKKRAMATFAADTSKDELEKAALEVEGIDKWIEGKTVRKIIVVPKRMINIVAN